MLANTYGIAMPAKMDIECQILSKCVPDPRDPSTRSRLSPDRANDQKSSKLSLFHPPRSPPLTSAPSHHHPFS